MSVLSSLSDFVDRDQDAFYHTNTWTRNNNFESHGSKQLLSYELSDAWGEAGIGEHAGLSRRSYVLSAFLLFD